MTGLSDGPTVVSTSHFGGQAPGTAWSRYAPANVRCVPSNHSIHILEEVQSLLLEYERPVLDAATQSASG
jgi:hypothetical protein